MMGTALAEGPDFARGCAGLLLVTRVLRGASGLLGAQTGRGIKLRGGASRLCSGSGFVGDSPIVLTGQSASVSTASLLSVLFNRTTQLGMTGNAPTEPGPFFTTLHHKRP